MEREGRRCLMSGGGDLWMTKSEYQRRGRSNLPHVHLSKLSLGKEQLPAEYLYAGPDIGTHGTEFSMPDLG